MSPVSVIPIFILFGLAGAVIFLLLRFTKMDVPKGKFVPIDGLRGILAFCVFLHHSAIWFYFSRSTSWAPTPSTVYNHFGPSSVAMFFMITAFLFYTKLLDAKKKGIDWLQLYVSRLFRIMPLYIFSVFTLFIIAGLISHFTFKESPLRIMGELIQWMFFIQADINHITSTRIIVAVVVWSLAFEWLFYCSLAFTGKFIFRINTPVNILITASVFFIIFLFIILCFHSYHIVERLCSFSGGIAAAFLARNSQIRKYCSSRWVSALLITLILSILLFSHDIAKPLPFVGICIIFIAIAAGNDIFGLLSHRLTRYLGMISYSLYLLHGQVLFTCFYLIIGLKKVGNLSPLSHWLTVGCCTILLILLCTLTYLYIEQPAKRKKIITAEKIRKAIV